LITSGREREELIELGLIARFAKQIFLSMVEPGMTSKKIDDFAKDFFIANNVESAPMKAYDFPGQTCISVNNIVAHGVPNDVPFRHGDVVNIDVSITRNGLWVDTGHSVVCGEPSERQRNLLNATVLARTAAIQAARPGAALVEIAEAIEKVADSYGLKVIENLGGHGVGKYIHEEPYISNCVKNAEEGVLKAGQVIAIEPILSYDSRYVVEFGDWELGTATQSAQFEHTIIVGNPSTIVT
jgi:methionyl aminopeptidase